MQAQNTFPASGNAGINTITPGYDMEVIGTVKTDTLLLGDNNVIGTANNAHLNFKISGTQIGRLEFDNVTGNQGQGAYRGNVFLGFEAGMSNSTGKRNVAIGTHAFRANVSGRASTAIGASALEDNTTGDFNVAVGEKTLPKNTTGMRNIAFGNEALFNNLDGHENIGIGVAALAANGSGSNNIGIGYTAGYGNTTGANNIAIGRSSLIGNSTGSDNTAIGHQANVGTDGLTNATAIGANALVSQSNSLILGNNANVGIGTSSPSEKLQVEGTIHSTTGGFKFPDGSIQTTAFDQNTTDAVYWQMSGNAGTNPGTEFIGTTDQQDLVFKTNGQERMRIREGGDHPGNVGIGTNMPEKKLHIVTTHTVCNTCSETHEGIRLEEQTYESSLQTLTVNAWDLQPYQNSKFAFRRPNQNPQLVITDNGRVGIGTTNPLSALQVHGSISIYDPAATPGSGDISLFFGQANTQGNTRGKWAVQYVAPNVLGNQGGLNFWIPALPGNNFQNNVLYLTDNGKIGIGTANPSAKLSINGAVQATAYASYSPIIFEAPIGTERMRIDDVTGNVSIGTGSDPNFRLSVCGDIRAHRIVIETFTCDFVFERNYKLNTLKERKTYVLKNKHLLNVPSAKNMDENGNDIGTTTMGILQNVEEHELFLYQHDEKIDSQSNDIKELRNIIKEQQKLLQQIRAELAAFKNQQK